MSITPLHPTIHQVSLVEIPSRTFCFPGIESLSLKDLSSFPERLTPSLPIELWQKVFEYTRPTITAGVIYPPILVCRIWHSAATSHTLLWSEIALDEKALKNPRMATRIKSWVKLSGAHRPLQVLVATCGHSAHRRDEKLSPWQYEMHQEQTIFPVTDTMKRNIEVLAQSVERWYDLEIYTTNNPLLRLILTKLESKATKLTRFRVSTLLGSPENLAISIPYEQAIYQDRHARTWATSFPNASILHIIARWSACSMRMIPRLGGETVTTLVLSQAVFEPHTFVLLGLQMPNIETLGLPDARFRDVELPESDWKHMEEGHMRNRYFWKKLKVLSLETPVMIPTIILRSGGPLVDSVHLHVSPWLPQAEVVFAHNLRNLPGTTVNLTIYCHSGDYRHFHGPILEEIANAFVELKRLRKLTFLAVGFETPLLAWVLGPDITPLIDAALLPTRLMMVQAGKRCLRPENRLVLEADTFVRSGPAINEELHQATAKGFIFRHSVCHHGKNGYFWTL
jgi:hypothetical protein